MENVAVWISVFIAVALAFLPLLRTGSHRVKARAYSRRMAEVKMRRGR